MSSDPRAPLQSRRLRCLLACFVLSVIAIACAEDPATHVWILAVDGAATEDGGALLERTVTVLERRADLLNDRLRRSGDDGRIRYVRPTPDGKIEVGVGGARAKEVDVASLLQDTEVRFRLLSGSDGAPGPVLIDNDDFEDMTPDYGPDDTGVVFELTRDAGARLEAATSGAVGDRLAIEFAGEVISEPVILDPVGRYGQIDLSGMSVVDRDRLVLAVRSGLLPAPVVVERRSDLPAGS